jgi:hypothetical protein
MRCLFAYQAQPCGARPGGSRACVLRESLNQRELATVLSFETERLPARNVLLAKKRRVPRITPSPSYRHCKTYHLKERLG